MSRAHRHPCPWPQCTAQVPFQHWGCRTHWHALPNNIRAWIGRAYRFGVDHECHPTRSYVEAHRAALAWIATQAASDEHADVVTLEGESP